MVYNTSIISDPNEPKNNYKALKGPENQEWWESAKNKFENFISQGYWEFVDHQQARKYGKTIVGSCWVFKKKN